MNGDQTRTERYAGDTSPLSVGQYIVMLIVLAIPIVNIIMMLVWAFGGNANLNKRNYARASLIMLLAALVLWIIIVASLGSFMNNLGSGY